MKSFVPIIISFLAFVPFINAQSDTLVVNLKNNQNEKIAVSQIEKIEFKDITSIREMNLNAGELSVKGNNPNPFNEQTNIEFEIATTGSVVIYIYDNSGNQIQRLECSNCQAGKNNCARRRNHRAGEQNPS